MKPMYLRSVEEHKAAEPHATMFREMRGAGIPIPQILHLFAFKPGANRPSGRVHAGSDARALAAASRSARADRRAHLQAQSVPVLNWLTRRGRGGAVGR